MAAAAAGRRQSRQPRNLGQFMKDNWAILVVLGGMVAAGAVVKRDTEENSRRIEGLASKEAVERVEAKLDRITILLIEKPK